MYGVEHNLSASIPPKEGSSPNLDGHCDRMLSLTANYVFTVQVRDGKAVSTIHSSNSAKVTGYSPGDYEADPFFTWAGHAIHHWF